MKNFQSLITTAIILFSGLLLNAQEGFSKWEKSYFESSTTEEQKEFINKLTIPSKVVLPKLEKEQDSYGTKLSWKAFFMKSFASWFGQTQRYRHSKSVAVAYGIFCLANFNTGDYRDALKNNLNDTIWMEKTYQAMKPLLKKAWPLLDQKTREIYIELIKEMDIYMKTFSYEAELNFLIDLQKTTEEYKFTSYRIGDSDYNEFRKAEAFVFRRMREAKNGNGNWSAHWVIKMLKKLKKLYGIK